MSASRGRHRDVAFTLIELLVAIAIIALLVSILVPSLAVARDMAKQAMCMSNMKCVGTAASMYISENNDWAVPLGGTWYSGTKSWAQGNSGLYSKQWAWADFLVSGPHALNPYNPKPNPGSYLDPNACTGNSYRSDSVVFQPADGQFYRSSTTYRPSRKMNCPAQPFAKSPWGSKAHYAWNAFFGPSLTYYVSDPPDVGYGWSGIYHGGRPPKVSMGPVADAYCMMLDAGPRDNWPGVGGDGWACWTGAFQSSAQYGSQFFPAVIGSAPHLKKANGLHLDGHVAAYTRAFMTSHSSGYYGGPCPWPPFGW
ncbi:MAG: type II secretion system protein [Phycisphaerae bacterium]